MSEVIDAVVVCGSIVLVESPYRDGDRARNLRYLAWCEYDAASRGEVPIASHGNCTAYWPEDDEHRLMGSAWRNAVRKKCDLVAYYVDLGRSPSQVEVEWKDAALGIARATRLLPPEMRREFDAGRYPPGSMRRVPAEQHDHTSFYPSIFGT